jgi:hypothetical protein
MRRGYPTLRVIASDLPIFPLDRQAVVPKAEAFARKGLSDLSRPLLGPCAPRIRHMNPDSPLPGGDTSLALASTKVQELACRAPAATSPPSRRVSLDLALLEEHTHSREQTEIHMMMRFMAGLPIHQRMSKNCMHHSGDHALMRIYFLINAVCRIMPPESAGEQVLSRAGRTQNRLPETSDPMVTNP